MEALKPYSNKFILGSELRFDPVDSDEEDEEDK
jgi:hypothetical protein